MKRPLCFLLAGILLALSAGCGKAESKPVKTAASPVQTAAAGVDVDLTKLNTTMIYSDSLLQQGTGVRLGRRSQLSGGLS